MLPGGFFFTLSVFGGWDVSYVKFEVKSLGRFGSVSSDGMGSAVTATGGIWLPFPGFDHTGGI